MSRLKSIFPIHITLYYILLILQLIFYFIKCEECSQCLLDSNYECKKRDEPEENCENCFPSFGMGKCYIKNNNNDYNSIYHSINNNGDFISMDSSGCQNKVINKNKECVGHCPKYTYELGDFCYLQNEFGTLNINGENLASIECKNKYYIEEISQSKRKQYNCLNSSTKCSANGYNYYNDTTNQCVNECKNKKIKLKKDDDDDEDHCTDECQSNDYLYSVINGQKTITYCSSNIPNDENCKYYYTSSNNINICINECDEKDFSFGKKCVSECSEKDGKIIIIDLSSTTKKIECKEATENKENFKFKYETNYYFKNCTDTQLLTKFKRITYESEYEPGQSKCVDDCSTETPNKYILNGEYKCTDCLNKYYYEKICYNECPLEHNYIIETNDGTTTSENTPPKQCADKCPAGYYESKNKICYPLSGSNEGINCPTGQFINSTFQCNTCNIPVNSFSIKVGEGYYVKDKKICYSSCPSNFLYHDNDNNECSSTICKNRESDYKYSAYDNPYICYKSCESISAEYKYEKDYICYKTQTTCDSYYYIENNVTQCASYDKCKEKGFKYIQEKQCVNNCKENYYRIYESYDTNNKIQNLGGCFPDERGCINEEYYYYNKTEKICLRECDAYKLSQTEKIKNEFGETCFSSCPSSQPFMDSANKLCLAKCPSYYYNNTCLTGTCKDNDKFNFEGEFECLYSCQKKIGSSTINYYFDSDTNICHYSCKEIEGKSFSIPIDNSPIECKVSCEGDYKYYYEDKKICRNSCDILYKSSPSESENDQFICVSQCASGQKVYNNTCYNDCPKTEESKIYKEKLNDKSSLIVEKCVKDCSNHLLSNSTNYCYDECPSNENYKYNNTCWENCPEGTFANPITKECHNGCPEGLNFYDIINGIKMCKIKCPSNKFVLSNETNGGMCYDKCPSDYNYIGGSNTCLKNCSEQPDIGQYIIEIDHSDEYPIYKCSFSCGENYTVIETKECHSECPNDSYTSPNKMCYSKNCSIDSDYPFSTIDDSGNKVCAKKCHKNETIFGDDKICGDKCNNENEVIDYDGKCVSKCENSYYKYYEDGKCVQKCSEGKKSLKNNTCVESCTNNENFLEGTECKTSCDSGHFQKYNDTTKETICVEKCDPEEFYYETGSIYNIYKCLPECNTGDYIIEGTQICVKECSSPYYTYFNGTDKRCVLKCPSDKPLNDLRTCVKECPKTGNKYHIEGETNCRYSCPEGSKIDNNECKSICPKEKYLDFKGENCINECVGNYLYYIEGIKQCLRECPIKDGYFIEDKKCVKDCSDEKPFLHGVYCQDSCSYYVEEYSHNNCTEKCPDDHPFYKKGKISDKDTKFCIRHCELSMPDGECVSQCNETYKHINYENGTCLKECPDFYVSNSDSDSGNITCYTKCPDDFPFYNMTTKECMNQCKENEYINITNNQCMNNCNFKTFNNSGNIYCLENCDDLGLFKFGENECLKDCSLGEENSNMVPNFATKTCECKQLYIIEEGKTICLPGEECNGEYNHRLFGTQMCLKDCNDYILSLDDKYCYNSEKYCPQNTKKIPYEQGENKYKCFCSFKFYKDGENYICLNENEDCPSEHKNLTLETNECVSSCDENNYVNVGNLCLNKSECDDVNNEKHWYYDENNNIKCTGDCPDKYNYLIEETKQCVSNCSQTEYYITHQKKCISTCPENTIVQKTYISQSDGTKELIYICACTTDLWYIDSDKKIICNSDETKTKCENIDPALKFQVKSTKECVKICPSDHPFSFDNECFINCEDIKNYYDYNIVESEDKKCKCKDLWKRVDNKMVCMQDKMCNGEGTNLLINDTRECTNVCPSEGGPYKTFNNTCYKECPSNTNVGNDRNSCICMNKWYKYKDSLLKVDDIIHCFDNGNEDCPKDFYPYLNLETNECIEDISKCKVDNKKIFNDVCYASCPENTKEDDNSNCVCDKDKGPWHQYTNNGKIYLVCGLPECPPDKIYLHNDTNECKYSCDDKYKFKNGCYPSCPDGTKLVDKLSKECTEYISFNETEDLENLNTKVENEIESIYKKTSTVGLVYNIKNSTMQIYGVNKKETPNHDLIMRSNLTYIDLSYCIDKLYKDNNLDDDADIVIVKYDIGDATDSTTINPVEFKLFNSENGEEISNLNGCKDNSIVISYPLSSILNNFPTESESKKLRNIEEKEVINLNLRQKFLKGKELNLENEEIDSFNIENKLYTDKCYPLKINGIDLILEDRVAYLYPEFTFCESNCVYNRTDFNLERIFCNCSPKDAFNLERQFVSQNTPVDAEKVKNNQKGSLLKCLFKVSNIAHNFGFFYGLIFILVEIGLMILTLIYSYKMLYVLIERKFNLNKNCIDLDNVENDKISDKIYKNKKKEEIIKTTERVLQEDGNPPKRNYKYNANDYNKKKDTKKVFEDKKKNKNKTDAVNTEKIEKLKIEENKDDKIYVSNSQNESYEKSEVSTERDIDDENIFDLIEAEEKLLRVDYDNALKNNKSEILITILTEIIDKIYLIKSIWLLQKYELFSLYFSLYLLWHMLLLSFLSLFYNNSTIHKIWIRDSYPDLSYYLSFGFVSGIISFIIYKALSFLINYNYKLDEIKNIPKEQTEQLYNKFKFWNKIKLIAYYIVEFALLIIFFLYLISFCGVYTGTQSKLIQSYGIALIEIVIIKIIYGLVLGILRRVSLSYKVNKLYNIVRLLDIYVS